MQTVVILIATFAASFGFALLYGVRLRCAVIGALMGLLGWSAYLALTAAGLGIFAATTVSAAAVALMAEGGARWMKVPVPLFLLPAIIPMVPGSLLYSAMLSLIRRDNEAARAYGYTTGQIALAIATGLGIVFAVFYVAAEIKKRRHAAR